MKIVLEKTEEQLDRFMNHIKPESGSWKCLYFDFLEHESEFTDIKRRKVVANMLTNLLVDMDGQIFFCTDGDLFIFSKSITPKSSEGIIKTINAIVTNAGGFQDYSHFYDLKTEWSNVSDLCDEKVNIIKEQSEAIINRSEDEILASIKIDKRLLAENILKRSLCDEIKVLIVEDDAFSRRLVKNSIKHLGQIIEADTGIDAIRKYVNHVPDIVFLDIGLPDINGQSVLQLIIENDPQAVIIMLSGNSFKENVALAIQNGAKGFIAKPFPKDRLMHYVHSINKCNLIKDI